MSEYLNKYSPSRIADVSAFGYNMSSSAFTYQLSLIYNRQQNKTVSDGMVSICDLIWGARCPGVHERKTHVPSTAVSCWLCDDDPMYMHLLEYVPK